MGSVNGRRSAAPWPLGCCLCLHIPTNLHVYIDFVLYGYITLYTTTHHRLPHRQRRPINIVSCKEYMLMKIINWLCFCKSCVAYWCCIGFWAPDCVGEMWLHASQYPSAGMFSWCSYTIYIMDSWHGGMMSPQDNEKCQTSSVTKRYVAPTVHSFGDVMLVSL